MTSPYREAERPSPAAEALARYKGAPKVFGALLGVAVVAGAVRAFALDTSTPVPADSLGGALTIFASHGPIGAVAIVAMYVAWKLFQALRESEASRLADRDACAAELAKERQARLEDAKAWLAQALQLSEKSYANADKLASVAETLTAVKRGGTP